jgi:pimeloyl-ACP methyl ester carboxylesterase
MATIALIPGGGDSPLSWEPVVARLRALGHAPVAIDLPAADPQAGWVQYAEAVVRAVRGASDVCVVGHSLGGFTAPLVCERMPVRRLILLAAMIPKPGALASNYWGDCGYVDGQFDEEAFYHDLSPEARALAKRAERDQSDTPMQQPSPLQRWPDVPTNYLLGENDRVFTAATSRRIVSERLGIVADEIEAGHCMHLARPDELAQRLHAYASA